VIIHANAVVAPTASATGCTKPHAKAQLGHVEIADDVEVGACTTIDRGTFRPTRIGEGTKIDNLVQVAHNCQIGKHNLFISQLGIAGLEQHGDYVVIPGRLDRGSCPHWRSRGDRCQGRRYQRRPRGPAYVGRPATPEREQKRIMMTLERLPEIAQRYPVESSSIWDDGREKPNNSQG